MRWGVLLGVLAGCGRVGFDPSPNADGGVDAGVDGAPGMLVLGTPRQVTADSAASRHPAMAWSGSRLGLMWRTGPAVLDPYFAELDADGTKIGERPATLAGGNQDTPELVWIGSDYAWIWTDSRTGNYETYFGRLAVDGSPVGAEKRIATAPSADTYNAELAWTGSELGALWTSSSVATHVRFVRVATDGTVLGNEVMLGATSHIYNRSSLVWTGTEYVAAWVDGLAMPSVLVQRISAAGEPLGTPVDLTPTGEFGGNPSLVWTGGELVVAYDECPASRSCPGATTVWLQRLDPMLAPLGPRRAVSSGLTASQTPRLFAGDGELLYAWCDGRVWLQRFTPTLVPNGDPLMIFDDNCYSPPPIVKTATGYAVAWETPASDVWVRVLSASP